MFDHLVSTKGYRVNFKSTLWESIHNQDGIHNGVVLMPLLLTLNRFHKLFWCFSIVVLEQVNAGWVNEKKNVEKFQLSWSLIYLPTDQLSFQNHL